MFLRAATASIMAIADFPALTPSARSWTPGTQPMTAFTSLAGAEVRVLHGSTPIGTQLQLSFSNLQEATANLITAHYLLARGTFELFDLPSAVYGGMSGYSNIKPAGSLWRYSGAPSVEYVSPGVQNVSVSLTAVPQ